MEKIKINTNAFISPMPMVLIGAMVGEKPNFMAAGWVSRVNANPPMIAYSSGTMHHTNAGIHANKTFSVNIPGKELVKKTDYCGLVSGAGVDKSGVFEVFYGALKTAPMAGECALSMECRLVNAIELPTNTLFIGEIVAAYSEERFLTNGSPDIRKMQPFTLTMPDNNYWTAGENIGKAWNIGKPAAK